MRPGAFQEAPETLIAASGELIANFEIALSRGERPRIEAHLPGHPDERRGVLSQLLLLESKFRLKSGEPVSVEDYQTRFPELQADTALVAELRRTVKKYDPIGVAGDVLEQRYRVTHCIGGGGMGFVYAARDLRFERADTNTGQVAIKFMRHAALSEDGFKREAHLMRQFRHHNFVEVYDYGVTGDGLAWLVMEYLPGSTVEQLLDRHQQRLPRELMVRFIREVCTALNSAHSRNLVHRDLKPANIILAYEDSPSETCFKILDFGLSTCIDAKGTLLNEAMNSAGTPAYMAPEQVTGWPVTQHADIYSLGVILFQLLTGHLPIDNTNAKMACYHHVHTAPKHFHEVAPDVVYPPAVEQIILKCLEKRPHDRPTKVSEVRDVLLAALEPPPVTPTAAGRSNGWKVAIAIAAVGVVCTAVLLGQWKSNSITAPATLPPPASTPIVPLPVVENIAARLPAEINVPLGREVSVPILWEWAEEDQDLHDAGPLVGQVQFSIQQPTGETGVPDGTSVDIQVDDGWESGMVQVSEAGSEGLAKRSGRRMLTLRARPNAPSASGYVMLSVVVRRGESTLRKQQFPLEVRVIWMPEGFANSPDAKVITVGGGGRFLYTGIERPIDGERVEFVLVPDLEGQPLKSFYIMKDKVWRGLFTAFLKATPQSVASDRVQTILNQYAEDRGSPRWPANNMKVEEAYACCRWIGGAQADLPSVDQWMRASGYEYYQPHRNAPSCWNAMDWPDGPYRGTAEEASHSDPPGFRDVGSSPRHVSCYGCRDLGSNGLEFLNEGRQSINGMTRKLQVPRDAVGKNASVQVRGMSPSSPIPLRFSNLSVVPQSQLYEEPHANVGFRVVINP